jgi:heme exporter protein C
VVAVIFALLVPVDHEATNWWQTLHQGNTLLRPDPLIHGWQLVSMLASFAAYGLIFAWLLLHRYRVEVLEDRYEEEGMAVAIAERRAEGSPTVGQTAATGPTTAGPTATGPTTAGPTEAKG